jgi:hypothetical protein
MFKITLLSFLNIFIYSGGSVSPLGDRYKLIKNMYVVSPYSVTTETPKNCEGNNELY